MFVRSKRIHGHTYYYLVKNERHGKQVKQKVIKYLGKEPWGQVPQCGLSTSSARTISNPFFRSFATWAQRFTMMSRRTPQRRTVTLTIKRKRCIFVLIRPHMSWHTNWLTSSTTPSAKILIAVVESPLRPIG